MSLTIIPASLTGLQRGVELAEVGIFVRRYEVRYHPEINEKIQDNFGETKGKVVSTVLSRDFTIEGEVTGATGVMALTQLIDCTASIANDKTTFGGSGIILLDEATETQERAGWRSVNLRLSSNPGITAV
jgi:hypothetical protein